MDQPGKVANPARGQLKRENNISLSPCVPENLVLRGGFSRPVPRQPTHLHTQARSGAYLRESSRVPRQRFIMKPSGATKRTYIGPFANGPMFFKPRFTGFLHVHVRFWRFVQAQSSRAASGTAESIQYRAAGTLRAGANASKYLSYPMRWKVGLL